METIKNQIASIVVFNATTLPELSKEYDNIQERLVEGLDKMKAAKIYSKGKIGEIRAFIYQILDSRYTDARANAVNRLRTEFTF